MRRLSVLVPLVLAFWSATAAGGAKEHFINGREYYDQGQYQDAIEEFEQAYRIDPKPLLLYNIAQAYEKLGNLKMSVDYLGRFLQEDANNEDAKSVENKIANLEMRIKQTGISVKANEEGAEIYVDDVMVGATPVSGIIHLDEGMHQVRLSKKGFKDFNMNIGVSVGYAVPVDAKLEPKPGAAPPVAPSPQRIIVKMKPGKTQPEPSAERAETKPTGKDEALEEPSRNKGIQARDVVPWVIAGVGAATAIVGLGVLGGMAASQNDHDKAILADIVGWPGVALAVIGSVWGIVRIVKKNKETAGKGASLIISPVACSESVGMAAAFNF